MTRSIRVLYPDSFPMVNKRCNSVHSSRWCQMPGLAVEIIQLLVKHLNMTVETVEHDPKFRLDQVFDNKGQFVGLYRHLENGSADLIATTTEPLEMRKSVWDFTNTLYQSETLIAVRKPDNTLSSVFDFFNVYGPWTWLLMLTTFCVFTSFGLTVRYVERKMGFRTKINGFSLIWHMFRLQVVQPSEILYKLKSGNLSLIVFAFLQCSIIVSLYQSWILTSVVRPKKAAPFNIDNLQKTLLDGKVLASALPNSWYYEMIATSNAEPYYGLRHVLKRNVIYPTSTVHESLELAESTEAIVIIQDDQFDGHVVSEYCKLETVMSPFAPQNETFMLRKDHPLLPLLNEAIEVQRVLIHRVFRKYLTFRRPSKCAFERKMRSLSLTPYLGVLLLLAIGLSISSFIFVIELIYGQTVDEETHEHYS